MDASHGLVILAWVSLSLAILSSLVVVVDLLAGNKQHMWIMNLVWPITALYFGPAGLWAYYKWGRPSSHRAHDQDKEHNKRPFWQSCFIGATHCGAGCTLADILVEWALVAFPVVVFGHKIFGAWIVDFIVAFIFGIAFQYFSIQPMHHLPVSAGIKRALKADALSLIAWQLGMYGWMALVTFVFFGHELNKASPVFWFMMQIAMWLGFLTSYPVNWLLLKRGIKEVM